jgi:dTDP-4-amino-4,6-dideoxygalactose transaminase
VPTLTPRHVPFFPYADLFLQDEEELTAVMVDVCRRGAFIMQKDCHEFDRGLREFIGARYAFGVANGTDAIILGLNALGVTDGDEVIVPSHTYIASAAAIHLVGATPVLAECGPDHMLDPDDIEHRITSRTKAIMPVQVNGRTCNMEAIGIIAEGHGLQVIEDAAQALGSRFDGRPAGTFGAFGTFSFYPAKVLGCFGDGGAIVTNSDELAERISLLRDHGRNEEGRVVAWGYNSRLDNIQAAILNHKLKSYGAAIERRRGIAGMYHDGLSQIEQLALPPGPEEDERHFDVYQNYEIEADRKDDLMTFLEDRGVRTIVQWAGTPVHRFGELGFEVSLPRTDAFFERCLMIPMNTAMSDEDVEYVVGLIRNFYEA